MSIDTLGDNESVSPISLTREEFDIIRNNFESSPQDHKDRAAEIMSEKGISYNSGVIDIEVEGKVMKMTTVEDDFGTVIQEPNPEEMEVGEENK